ncbi:MMEL1 [Lepeophtheirus salmonis]|uniref:MMEL1 n=1 Tax=Lepeophtheirus salmonis TaxID=72036 RepID=A0A7R8CGS8_LEPSM|nr:MMEL1 [Lepeophtheirus salmonis]CAF2818532.1 MMEL1 [Lepeophtheirus salmonis]
MSQAPTFSSLALRKLQTDMENGFVNAIGCWLFLSTSNNWSYSPNTSPSRRRGIILLMSLSPSRSFNKDACSNQMFHISSTVKFGDYVSYFQIIHHNTKKNKICLTQECVQTSAYLLGAMDTTADPCTDFFQYACGAWNRKHVIPEDRSSISTFEVMADQLQIILKGLLEEDHNEFDCEATLKVKNFYKSCMNISQIERISDTPLVQAINGLGGWPVVDPYWTSHNWTIERVIGILKKNFTLGIFIEEWVGPDDRNSSAHIIQIDQMTFGLPSRDYFLLEESDRDLKAYHIYMTEVGALLGANKTYAYEQFQNVIRFEKSIANISVPEHDRINTVMGIGYIGDNEQIVSYSMPYFKLLGKLLKQTDKKIIHNYMIWRTVLELMPHLPPQYESTRAEFRRVLLGVLTGRIRWHKCVDWANKKMGMAVGALFIRDNFNYDSKEIALSMIHDIREAFNDLLEENEWMDEETRLVAKDKANSMNERIGYPEYITNKARLNQEYENLSITPVNFLDNLFNILRFEASNNQRKLRLAVDKDKWQTEPAVVNAFYNPNKNDIVFPAGILQPLFYSQHFPKSLNYGGIGVVIGHEITHGFDDKGRQFDKFGNLKQWWNNRTIAEFHNAAQMHYRSIFYLYDL